MFAEKIEFKVGEAGATPEEVPQVEEKDKVKVLAVLASQDSDFYLW